MIDDHGENGMGEEYEHDFIIECDCPKCGSLVRVTASCYEYPAGALDYGPIFDASGCDIIEEPVIDIDYSDEIEYSGLRVPPIRDRIPANRAMIPLCFQ